MASQDERIKRMYDRVSPPKSIQLPDLSRFGFNIGLENYQLKDSHFQKDYLVKDKSRQLLEKQFNGQPRFQTVLESPDMNALSADQGFYKKSGRQSQHVDTEPDGSSSLPHIGAKSNRTSPKQYRDYKKYKKSPSPMSHAHSPFRNASSRGSNITPVPRSGRLNKMKMDRRASQYSEEEEDYDDTKVTAAYLLKRKIAKKKQMVDLMDQIDEIQNLDEQNRRLQQRLLDLESNSIKTVLPPLAQKRGSISNEYELMERLVDKQQALIDMQMKASQISKPQAEYTQTVNPQVVEQDGIQRVMMVPQNVSRNEQQQFVSPILAPSQSQPQIVTQPVINQIPSISQPTLVDSQAAQTQTRPALVNSQIQTSPQSNRQINQQSFQPAPSQSPAVISQQKKSQKASSRQPKKAPSNTPLQIETVPYNPVQRTATMTQSVTASQNPPSGSESGTESASAEESETEQSEESNANGTESNTQSRSLKKPDPMNIESLTKMEMANKQNTVDERWCKEPPDYGTFDKMFNEAKEDAVEWMGTIINSTFSKVDAKREQEEAMLNPSADDMWEWFHFRVKITLLAVDRHLTSFPVKTMAFLHAMTQGHLSIPKNYLLPFEQVMLGDVLDDTEMNLSRRMFQHSKATAKQIQERARERFLVIACFLISKTFSLWTLENAQTQRKYLSNVNKKEYPYFHLISQTTLAIFTDVLFEVFRKDLVQANPDLRISEQKNHLQQMIMPAKLVNSKVTYKTFMFNPDKQSFWDELTFIMTQILSKASGKCLEFGKNPK